MKLRPLIITIGEPAGIGPEIIAKACVLLKNKIPFFVIGDFSLLERNAYNQSLKVKEITDPFEVFEDNDSLPIMNHELKNPVIPGQIETQNSSSSISILKRAVSLINTRKASALVTCPIDKWALKASGLFDFEGHTDYLSFLDKTEEPATMMLENNLNFRVVPITIHIPLTEVSNRISKKKIEQTVLTVNNHLKTFCSIKKPKILITGLNPHSGEKATVGTEETNVIIPSIKSLLGMGLNIKGPVPADTAFTLTNREEFDVFICMYHDQALIPFKLLSFESGVNISLGLSFVRTSPCHGTAIDIAGKNVANPASLISAIKSAQRYSSKN